ncbi:hypothetical protein CEUSTIGMA_g9531.t1 [Chlamydomonas eustigma]|uniref:protein O-GlcNAc transferase n=1 Tax=Chlamydomonas eustigma TaxID=1157962 RepID=A0A250XGC2_9CHLO|nr:hypothetical protein CEUSTIGMA_g9531.t1 [Chlamydomonas eustigma]|eukprot:GAX82103.1 hypothetical protein CEUSTIGMA_g9531.t1 [Chlamydomonas eustigma]
MSTAEDNQMAQLQALCSSGSQLLAMQKGLTDRSSRDYSPAQACYLEALRLRPAYVPAWLGLGHIYREQNQNRLAIPCYQEALRQQLVKGDDLCTASSSSRLDVLYLLGTCLSAEDRAKEAVDCFQTAVMEYHHQSKLQQQLRPVTGSGVMQPISEPNGGGGGGGGRLMQDVSHCQQSECGSFSMEAVFSGLADACYACGEWDQAIRAYLHLLDMHHPSRHTSASTTAKETAAHSSKTDDDQGPQTALRGPHSSKRGDDQGPQTALRGPLAAAAATYTSSSISADSFHAAAATYTSSSISADSFHAAAAGCRKLQPASDIAVISAELIKHYSRHRFVPQAMNNLGNALRAAGKVDLASLCYKAVCRQVVKDVPLLWQERSSFSAVTTNCGGVNYDPDPCSNTERPIYEISELSIKSPAKRMASSGPFFTTPVGLKVPKGLPNVFWLTSSRVAAEETDAPHNWLTELEQLFHHLRDHAASSNALPLSTTTKIEKASSTPPQHPLIAGDQGNSPIVHSSSTALNSNSDVPLLFSSSVLGGDDVRLRSTNLLGPSLSNLGDSYRILGLKKESLRAYRLAAELQPLLPYSWTRLAAACRDAGQPGEAAKYFGRALELAPNNREAFAGMVFCMQCVCDWKERAYNLVKLQRYVRMDLASGRVPHVQPFHAMALSFSADLALAVSQRYARECFEGMEREAAQISPFNHHSLPPGCNSIKGRTLVEPQKSLPCDGSKGRLKIGYMSCDFGEHPLTHLMAAVFECHDRSKFEVSCYALNPDDDSHWRKQVKQSAERFVDLSGLRQPLQQYDNDDRMSTASLSADAATGDPPSLQTGHRSDGDASAMASLQQTLRMAASARSISGISFEAAVARVLHAEGLHILVDLSGYTNGSCPGIFAWRPAPVQVCLMGFPATMGAPYLPYMIVDNIVAPKPVNHMEENLRDSNSMEFSEALVRMPDSYFVCSYASTFPLNEVLRQGITTNLDDSSSRLCMSTSLAMSRSSEGLPERPTVVYCCFNQLYKLDPEILEVWCRILVRVPNSVLWLLRFPLEAEENLLRSIQKCMEDMQQIGFTSGSACDAEPPRISSSFENGCHARSADPLIHDMGLLGAGLGMRTTSGPGEEAVDLAPRRVIFSDVATKTAHLARLAMHADVFLDTPSCNAHTSACDALWAGCPLITLPGSRMAGRVAASLAHATGLGEQMVVNSLQAYEERAVQLGINHRERTGLREQLKEARLSCPLFDTVKWVRHFECAVDLMWAKHSRGEEPGDIDVPKLL